MIDEGIKNAMSALGGGLSIALLWLQMSQIVYYILCKYKFEFKSWEKQISIFDGCSMLAMMGVLLAVILLFSPALTWGFEHTPYYVGVSLLVLLATTLILIWIASWVFYLVRRGGIWPSEWHERIKFLIVGVTLMIVLVTLSLAGYLWFRR